MDELQIRTLVRQLDTKERIVEEAAWVQLRPIGVAVVSYFGEFYPNAKTAACRRAIMFHTIRYARVSEAAFQLGVAGLSDRASIVRYRACAVLAYSLRCDALPHLEGLLKHQDQKSVEDARAAIDAIKRKNHHYFVDREHTGQMFWEVNDEDAPTC